MNFVKWCWGDVLVEPQTKREHEAFNRGSAAALAGYSMDPHAEQRLEHLRPFWVAGWRVARMTVIAGACGPIISSPEQVREALSRERSKAHKKAIGPLFAKLGV